MDLPLDPKLSIGIQTLHRRTEPATGPWLPRVDELVALVEVVDRCGYDALWVGDRILERALRGGFPSGGARYGTLGTPDQVAERIRAFHTAGARHISIDLLGRYEEHPAQIERFAAEVLPLLTDLRGWRAFFMLYPRSFRPHDPASSRQRQETERAR